MIYINSFIFCGLTCLIGEILLDNTNLTPGHITSIFVSLGSILSFLNIYQIFTKYIPVASSIPILSFGNLLYQSSLKGYYENGLIGLFSNMLTTTSLGISYTVVISFIVTLFSKPKD